MLCCGEYSQYRSEVSQGIRFSKASHRVATAQIAVAVLLCILEITGLALGINRFDAPSSAGSGIWSGVVFVVAAIVGLVAVRATYPSRHIHRGRFIAALVLSIICIHLAIALFCLSLHAAISTGMRDSREMRRYYNHVAAGQAIRIVSVILYFTELVLFCVSTKFTCANMCCQSSNESSDLKLGEYESRFRGGRHVLASVQIALACPIIILEITGLALKNYQYDMVDSVGAGVWGGVLFLLIAAASIFSVRKESFREKSSNRRHLIAYISFNIIGVVLAVALFITSVIVCVLLGWSRSGRYEYVRNETDGSRYGTELSRFERYMSERPLSMWIIRIASVVLYATEAVLFCITASFGSANIWCRSGSLSRVAAGAENPLSIERIVRCRKGSCGVAIAQIVMAGLLVVLEITGISLESWQFDCLSKAGAGIWSGVLFLAAGLVGLAATRVTERKRSGGRFVASVVLSTISCILAAVLFSVCIFVILSTWGPAQSSRRQFVVREQGLDLYKMVAFSAERRKAFHAILIVNACSYFAEFILFCVSASFGCGNVCCRPSSLPVASGSVLIYQVPADKSMPAATSKDSQIPLIGTDESGPA